MSVIDNFFWLSISLMNMQFINICSTYEYM